MYFGELCHNSYLSARRLAADMLFRSLSAAYWSFLTAINSERGACPPIFVVATRISK